MTCIDNRQMDININLLLIEPDVTKFVWLSDHLMHQLGLEKHSIACSSLPTRSPQFKFKQIWAIVDARVHAAIHQLNTITGIPNYQRAVAVCFVQISCFLFNPVLCNPYLELQLDEVDNNVGKSRRIIGGMMRKMDRNKWIIGLIIAVLVLAILVILYFKFVHQRIALHWTVAFYCNQDEEEGSCDFFLVS